MNKLIAAAIGIAAVTLTACATADGEAYRKAKLAQGDSGQALTGSRLVKPTTERVVKAVGNNEYNEQGNLHTSIGNTVGAKSN